MTVRLIGHEESFEVRYSDGLGVCLQGVGQVGAVFEACATSANEPTLVGNAAKLIRRDLFRPARTSWAKQFLVGSARRAPYLMIANS